MRLSRVPRSQRQRPRGPRQIPSQQPNERRGPLQKGALAGCHVPLPHEAVGCEFGRGQPVSQGRAGQRGRAPAVAEDGEVLRARGRGRTREAHVAPGERAGPSGRGRAGGGPPAAALGGGAAAPGGGPAPRVRPRRRAEAGGAAPWRRRRRFGRSWRDAGRATCCASGPSWARRSARRCWRRCRRAWASTAGWRRLPGPVSGDRRSAWTAGWSRSPAGCWAAPAAAAPLRWSAGRRKVSGARGRPPRAGAGRGVSGALALDSPLRPSPLPPGGPGGRLGRGLERGSRGRPSRRSRRVARRGPPAGWCQKHRALS